MPANESNGPPLASAKALSRWQQLLRSDDARIVAMVLSLKLLLFLFVAISYYAFANQRIHGALGWLQIWDRWDALHYLRLAQHGYTAKDKLLLVFYPLYPWLVRAAHFIFRNYLFSGFVVSTVASVATALLLYRLGRVDLPALTAERSVWFLFIFPTSYFLHITYTESVFLALVLGAFLAARRQQWLIAAVLGALASLTRTNGVLLVPALALEAALIFRRTRQWQWQWLWILMIPCGFLVYLWLNAHVTGNPFFFQTAMQEHWRKSLSSPLHGIMEAWRNMRRPPSDAVMVGMHEVLFALIGFVCTVICLVRQRASYGLWMILNWALFAATSFVQSIPRYTLVLFPMFFLFAQTREERLPSRLITAFSLLFLGTFAVKFAQGQWAF
ncbi:MAG: glycosyltransferase family 39 protein [Chthoniobacterales bacterium]